MSRTSRDCTLAVLASVFTLTLSARVVASDDESEPVGPVLITQLGHSSNVAAVAFSPDGELVLTGSWDRTARLWETATGRAIRRFEGHRGSVTSVVFSPDGTQVLTGSNDDTARLWDAATGRVIRRFEGHDGDVMSVAFSPDSTHVLTGSSDKTARLWETQTGKEVQRYEGHDAEVWSVGFSPDGQLVLTGSKDKTARLWEAPTGAEVRRLEGHEGWVRTVAFSPEGTHVLTGSADKTVRLWEVESGSEVWIEQQDSPDGVASCAFNDDGRLVLTQTSYDVCLRATSTGAVMRRITDPERLFFSAAFSPDGRHVLTGFLVFLDASAEAARLWETGSGREVRRFEALTHEVTFLASSPDGTYLIAQSHDHTASLWEIASGRMVWHHRGDGHPVSSVAFSPDSRSVLAGCTDGTAGLWNIRTGREARRFTGHREEVTSVAFSRDGAHVLTGSSDKTARLWEAATGKEVRRFEGHEGQLLCVAFSLDGSYVGTGSSDKTVRLWKAETGEEVRCLRHFDRVQSIAFSPDGRTVLTGCLTYSPQQWDIETGEKAQGYSMWPWGVASVAFSPDGRHVVATGASGTVWMWDAASGEVVRSFRGHRDTVWTAAYTPDGRHLMTGSADGTRVWDADTGSELCSLISFRDGSWAVVAPDGRFDAGDLEGIRGLHWLMPDDPMRTISAELFLRDYYEPGLLPRLLATEDMGQVRSLTDLNRAQPFVKVVGVEPEPDGERTVRVTVELGSRSFRRGGHRGDAVQHSGVHDLRLFRDGQVVAWRDGDLGVGDEDERITFEGIRIPMASNSTDITFSAYAFNSDGVKSRTARETYEVKPSVGIRRGTAYVIAFGVDRFADSKWNLSYAAADAKFFGHCLVKALSETSAWAHVVPMLLTSTDETSCGRKEDLRAALAELARKASPEDLVILAVSTHGLATGDGSFLLLPSDATFGEKGEVLPESCISTDDLRAWLRPVDAGEMAMIVDACQSAASVEQEGFKPGPMGSRGFGQLAWNKKMRILAASQASEYALESRQLRHGLLTHALVREGLEAGEADAGESKDGAITLQEWLAYGESRVPALAEAIALGEMEAVGPKGPLRKENRPEAGRVVQRPSLFDFSRPGRRETVIRSSDAADDGRNRE